MKINKSLKEIPTPHNDFKESFRSSDRFGALISNTQKFLEVHPRTHRMDFQGSFAGRLFEELGYLWYGKQLGTDQRLLDPDETLQYFLDLYAGMPSQTFLQGGILNEYVPDGVILGDGIVGGNAVIVEYTVRGPKPSSLPKYIHHKGVMVGNLRKRFPEIFGHGRLEIVFTQDTHETIMRTRGLDPRTTLISAPYKHDEVHAFAQELVGTHFDLTK